MKLVALIKPIVVVFFLLPFIVAGQTTWDGTNWDNGAPTPGMIQSATIAADYNTEVHGSIYTDTLTINSGVEVKLANYDTILVSKLDNQGWLAWACKGIVQASHPSSYYGSSYGFDPVVAPVLPDAYAESPYSSSLSYSNCTTPVWTVNSVLPIGLSFNSATAELTGTIIIPGTYNLSFSLQESGCTSSVSPAVVMLEVLLPITTWNGSSWSNGTPDATKNVVLNAPYSHVAGTLTCEDLTITGSGTLAIYNGATVQVNGVYDNTGILYNACTGILNYEDVFRTGTTQPLLPIIQMFGPTTYSPGDAIQLNFVPANCTSPNWMAPNLLPGLTFDQVQGVMTGVLDDNIALGTQQIGVVSLNQTGCPESQYFNVSIEVVPDTTIWNGSFWSNGLPTQSKVTILQAPYNTSLGNIECYDLIVYAFLDVYTTTSVSVHGTVYNYGRIEVACLADFYYMAMEGSGVYESGYPDIIFPIIPTAKSGVSFVADFQGVNVYNPQWTFAGLPSGLSYDPATGVVSGSVHDTVRSRIFDVSVRLTELTCVPDFTDTTFKLTVDAEPSPGLTVPDFFMTYGENGNSKTVALNAAAGATSYSVETNSTGKLKYSISPANQCVSIDSVGRIIISCAGANSTNVYTVTVKQEDNAFFGSDSTTASVYILKKSAEIEQPEKIFLLTNTNPLIEYELTSDNEDAIVTFTQTAGFNVATVASDGTLNLLSVGEFEFDVTVAETNKYGAKTIRKIIREVRPGPKPPIAVSDTISVFVGFDFSVNILKNDTCYMSRYADTSKVDLNVNADGVQSTFLDPATGTFIFDTLSGVLTCKPFRAVLGDFTLSYNITDQEGNKSNDALIYITIVQPGERPELKATELVTPNNDGMNDAFVIGYTDNTKSNVLTIFDRYGAQIFSADNYKNDWEGTDQDGEGLPAGVYFYLFNENEGEKEIKGMVEIRR